MKHSFAIILCWLALGNPVRTIDGDTFTAIVTIWPNLTSQETIRVLGVNTPELKTTTKAAGEKSKAFTEVWLSQGLVTLETCGRDAFGRLLAKASRGDLVLADELIKNGLGVKFVK